VAYSINRQQFIPVGFAIWNDHPFLQILSSDANKVSFGMMSVGRDTFFDGESSLFIESARAQQLASVYIIFHFYIYFL
jgi:hypothetical protein